MHAATINRIVGINESYKLPGALMSALLGDPVAMMDQFMMIGEPLEHDWFTGYFEEEHANKSKMAQDFTPPEVCDLLAHVVGLGDVVGDVCAGTGGLTIGMWSKNKDATFLCYEYSERALPLLLFNLAVRNIDAYVCRCNLLTGEEFEYYKTTRGSKYSRVEAVGEMPDLKCDLVVSNPPYSQKYDPKSDQRFPEYKDMLPSNFADFVFVAFGLTLLKGGGKAGFILPHGVLFRSNKEGAFRKMLVESGTLRSIIGLPDKLFINTDIPTCILEMQTRRAPSGILIIDAKDEAQKAGKKNIITGEHLRKICEAYDARTEAEGFAHVAPVQEVAGNQFNLNIPRYVDSFVHEPLPDFVEVMENLGQLEKDIVAEELRLLEMVRQLYGTTPQADERFRKGLRKYKQAITNAAGEYEQGVMKLEP